ncbi:MULTISPECIES: hypothetical protein [unclassified Corynebacterium]|uniref:hypothetical protein n=1 Tax=unclassified Corynebacterium TaxID=2624378 RepID=UPI0029C9D29B|nr:MULTISPECIES: hypothetical protein [unclassified Corynebacterium]WPF66697.1 hypothetical protein OLX12_02905 [Corynebacterium sp. 22KM0430]WPF69184.1 hypothetical protein OLW90_02900 [Corynebacterium sp. 21KM1197]
MITDMIVQSHDAVMGFVDVVAMPGQNIRPQAPGEFGAKINNLLNIATWVAIAICIFGVIASGITFLVARNRGMSEEVTEMALRIGGGCLLVGSASGVVQMLM